MDHYLLSHQEISKSLNTDPKGLDNSAVKQRIEKYGKNELVEKEKKSAWQILLYQFKDFMIIVLFAAAVISGIIGELTDTIVIMVILVVNAIIGFIQEYRAEKAMDALNRMAATKAQVIREGKSMEIDSTELVPGDVVVLEGGSIIPADLRFFETNSLNVDESSLTGESSNVEKNHEKLSQGEYPLAERLNMGYKGTAVTKGNSKGYVIATGMDTELGRIAKSIQTADSSTPLQKRLATFGRLLTIGILIICVIFFLVGWLRGESVGVLLLTAISLAVAAIPEALPALVTIALAIGARRIVKSKALIRKLPAVETLGSVTFICTDKTGTLTENNMSVQEIYESPEDLLDFFGKNNALLSMMALNNDVTLKKEGEKEEWLGESTEVAMARYAFNEKKLERKELEEKYPRTAELPFDSDRKLMTTFHETEKGIIAITKGAAEVLFDKLSTSQKKLIPGLEKKSNEMAEKGYRVLGYACKHLESLPKELNAKQIESDLTFTGFAGLIDPPRRQAKKAVEQCKAAGIIPVMITGDHKLTAKAIAEMLGIVSSEKDKVIDGGELEKLDSREFGKIIEDIRVYARVDPQQKLRIIETLQDRHHFVAMTGDGVNDAPALKKANIGIAMGISGTEVAKEAAHMILLDDNFSTIVKAIKHGRRIFDNILKFIKYIMTGNSGEIWTIFLAPLLGLPIPLLPIHILWINLVTDGLPGLALASEPTEPNAMKRPPRDPKQNIFAGGMGWHILWVGLLIGGLTIGTQAWALNKELPHWQTMTFSVLCFTQLWHVMAIRSEQSIFKAGFFSNKPMIIALSITILMQLTIIYIPFFNKIFKTQPLSAMELLITFLVSSVVFLAVEIEKLIRRR